MTGIYLKGDEDLSAFDSVEVHPVAEYGDFVDQVSEDEVGSDPDARYFWSVYLHYKTGGLDCVADFETEAGAKAYATELRKRLNKALPDGDYVLAEGAAWFDVKGFSIRIHSTDEGVIVDIFSASDLQSDPFAEPISSTYAHDTEAAPEETA